MSDKYFIHTLTLQLYAADIDANYAPCTVLFYE